jgi:hypothetical protein
MLAKPWEMDSDVLKMPWQTDVMPSGPLCFAIIYGDEDVSGRTVAAFPTGLRQDPTIDLPIQDFQPKSEDDKRLQGYCKLSNMLEMRRGLIADNDPEMWRGAPIGLQLIGGRLEEEKMVGMLCEIRDALEST